MLCLSKQPCGNLLRKLTTSILYLLKKRPVVQSLKIVGFVIDNRIDSTPLLQWRKHEHA